MIGGVCTGLAEYFDIDVTLVRALFVAATVVSGFGAILYVVLWILLDDVPPPPPAPPPVEVGLAATDAPAGTGTLAEPPTDTLAAPSTDEGAETPVPTTAEEDLAVPAPADQANEPT